MQIEKDQVEILSGVRFNRTTGGPVTLVIENKDWKKWSQIMSINPQPEQADKRRVTRPRPGHADLNGAIKYGHRDIRDVLERSSARETTARVAVGAVARQLLQLCGIQIASHVVRIGSVVSQQNPDLPLSEIAKISEESPVRCLDVEAEKKMIQEIDQAKEAGDSLGGVVEVLVEGVPVGLGSHVHWDRKLDGQIAQAIVSIQAFKGVEFGIGFAAGERLGSEVHDEIMWKKERGYYRATNRAGGFEGGMTTGERLVIRGVMKPISTLYKPLRSVNIDTKMPQEASIERSDTCAVPAAAVIAENVVAWEVARSLMETFSRDTMDELMEAISMFRQRAKEF